MRPVPAFVTAIRRAPRLPRRQNSTGGSSFEPGDRQTGVENPRSQRALPTVGPGLPGSILNAWGSFLAFQMAGPHGEHGTEALRPRLPQPSCWRRGLWGQGSSNSCLCFRSPGRGGERPQPWSLCLVCTMTAVQVRWGRTLGCLTRPLFHLQLWKLFSPGMESRLIVSPFRTLKMLLPGPLACVDSEEKPACLCSSYVMNGLLPLGCF